MDLNHGRAGYEPAALPTELWARTGLLSILYPALCQALKQIYFKNMVFKTQMAARGALPRKQVAPGASVNQ